MGTIRELIQITGQWDHLKASESYVAVKFNYPTHGWIWDGAVPTEYRRGPNIHVKTTEELWELLEQVYDDMHPDNKHQWMKIQDQYWRDKRDGPTKKFFHALWHCEWICATCALPGNPNWARRWQDLKEAGYTTATIPAHNCDVCEGKRAKIIMLRLPREGKSGYEVIPPKVRKKIMRVLHNHDVYEDHYRAKGLLPDHKFPGIRWDKDTRGVNTEDMTVEEIRDKFQLMDNRRNQQKREVCRKCYQTGGRGFPFGIEYWYSGDQDWPSGVPMQGIEAERGCFGCGWYDLEAWRDSLNKT